jgi:hypothetical protein
MMDFFLKFIGDFSGKVFSHGLQQITVLGKRTFSIPETADVGRNHG